MLDHLKRGWQSDGMTRKHFIAITLALLIPTAALAQQSQTIYGSDGKVSGRTRTDSRGSTTFFDASGRVTGRAATSGNTTTFYDSAGRKTGSVTTIYDRAGRRTGTITTQPKREKP